jgi:hypothetical protein
MGISFFFGLKEVEVMQLNSRSISMYKQNGTKINNSKKKITETMVSRE